jgi:fatty-acyl-CoA synthase
VTLTEYFGATEGLMGFRHTNSGQMPRTGSFDLAPGVRVLGQGGHDVGPGSGEAGVIHIPAVMFTRYENDPEGTQKVFRTVDGHRYAVPGDWGVLDPDGSLQVLGRGASVINTGGEKVFPEEVENVIQSLPGVRDCLVVGIPDPTWGERVVAVIVPEAGQQPFVDEVRSAVKERLAGFKVPRGVVFVDEPLRFANGKPDHSAARRAATRGESREVR